MLARESATVALVLTETRRQAGEEKLYSRKKRSLHMCPGEAVSILIESRASYVIGEEYTYMAFSGWR